MSEEMRMQAGIHAGRAAQELVQRISPDYSTPEQRGALLEEIRGVIFYEMDRLVVDLENRA